jgi:putative methyltransferase (TIGR04325 family)
MAASGETRDRTSAARRLGSIAGELAQLPGLQRLARPMYRRSFRRPFRNVENSYYGVYGDYTQAAAAAREFASQSLPASYDVQAASRAYRNQLEAIRVSDYPLLFWLSRLIAAGNRNVFDLGGNIGVTYYGFGRYIEYPHDLRWQVHDMPVVMAAGRQRAAEHDPGRRLSFADAPELADGADVLVSTGALQYLDYTLADLLRRLQRPPANVLVNLTPVHPSRGYFTLQNLSFAVCPYRVMARPEFLADMQALGYRLVDEWQSRERCLSIPFEPGYAIDNYSGFCFRREDGGNRATA